MGSHDDENLCIRKADGKVVSFVSSIQFFWQHGYNTEEYSACGLSCTYHSSHFLRLNKEMNGRLWKHTDGKPASIVLGRATKKRRRRTEWRHFREMFHIFMAIKLVSSVRIPTGQVWREEKIRVLYKSMAIVAGPLRKSEQKWLSVCARQLVDSRCVPILVSKWFDFSECDDKSKLRCPVELEQPCVARMVSRDDIISSQKAH